MIAYQTMTATVASDRIIYICFVLLYLIRKIEQGNITVEVLIEHGHTYSQYSSYTVQYKSFCVLFIFVGALIFLTVGRTLH